MDGFLLLALLVYLAVSYVPISKSEEDIHRNEPASPRNAEMDASRQP